VAHNARFDVAFLRAEWNRSGLGSLDLDAVDTLQMARQLNYPGRLARLAEALGVPLVDAHQALDDTRALACVLVALLDSGGVLPSPLPAFWPPLLTPAPSGQVALRPTPVA
jgi:DNA polymerase III alpha subunit (gram-positive type)